MKSGAGRGSLFGIVAIALLALSGLILAIYPAPAWLLGTRDGWPSLTPEQRFQHEGDLRTSLLQGLAGTFVLIGSLVALRQISIARFQAEVQKQAHFVDSFSRAIEQLAGDQAATRVGGVFALDRLAELNAWDAERIGQVLESYVRSVEDFPRYRTSVETAVTVLAARGGGRVVNLSQAVLPGIDMGRQNLSGWEMSGCDLREADLRLAVMKGASLKGADLTRADLRGADLSSADLDGARLAGMITDAKTRLPELDPEPS